MPISLGSQPVKAQFTSLPMGLTPFLSAQVRVAITALAAPSQMPDAAPGWMRPSFLKALGSFLKPSTVESGRPCSSFSNITEPFFDLSSTGAISFLKRPASWAAAWRFWERMANSSTCSWVSLYCSPRFSAVSPIGMPA